MFFLLTLYVFLFKLLFKHIQVFLESPLEHQECQYSPRCPLSTKSPTNSRKHSAQENRSYPKPYGVTMRRSHSVLAFTSPCSRREPGTRQRGGSFTCSILNRSERDRFTVPLQASVKEMYNSANRVQRCFTNCKDTETKTQRQRHRAKPAVKSSQSCKLLDYSGSEQERRLYPPSEQPLNSSYAKFQIALMTVIPRSTGSIKGLRPHMKAQQLQGTGMKGKKH